jgi:hypothetical protein
VGAQVETAASRRTHKHHREPLAKVAPAPRIASDLAAEGVGDAAGELAGAVEQKPLATARLVLARQRLEQPRLRLRTDPRRRLQPARERGLAQLLGAANAERPRQLQRATRAQTEVAPEPDEVRRELTLKLGELRDRAGLDQLAQPPLDPGADAAQLAHASRPHEISDANR